MKQQYRVAWYYKKNPHDIRYGGWRDDKKTVQTWVDRGNKNWPDIHHFVDEKIKLKEPKQ